MCADEIVGSSASRRTSAEWVRTYRALNHGRSEAALDELNPKRKSKGGSPGTMHPDIRNFCGTLEDLRHRRISADYDPQFRKLRRQEVVELIDEAEAALGRLEVAPTDQRRTLAFACIVLLRRA